MRFANIIDNFLNYLYYFTHNIRMINSDIIIESSKPFLNCQGLCVIEKTLKHGLKKSSVNIEDRKQSEKIGKKAGSYVSFSVPEENFFHKDYLIKVISESIVEFLKKSGFGASGTVLVTGLGNENFAADSLGIKTTEKLKVSKDKSIYVFKSGIRLIALAPNVSANTGIDSFEITKSVIDRIKPDAVIAVDSLSASSFKKVGKVYQLTDAGIRPGSGIGRGTNMFDKEGLGLPVIAVGVPLVVSVYNIVRHFVSGADISDSERRELETLCVTPKNIESLIDFASEIIGGAINSAAENYIFK